MASGITVKVEMREMFIDYLVSNYYSEKHQMVFASENNQFGLLIKNLLRKTPPGIKHEKKSGPHVEIMLPDYTLPYRDYNLIYNYISHSSEKLVMKWVRKQFYFELHEFITDMHLVGQDEIKASINLFCDQKNIHPDHYKENSLYKEYYRWRVNKRCEKTQNISRAFAAVLSIISLMLVIFY